jgi:hypothetical protein
MKRLGLMGLAIGIALFFTERGRRARQVYAEEVSSGSRPIEAVGTAIAAFIGVAPAPSPNNARNAGEGVEKGEEPPPPVT